MAESRKECMGMPLSQLRSSWSFSAPSICRLTRSSAE